MKILAQMVVDWLTAWIEGASSTFQEQLKSFLSQLW